MSLINDLLSDLHARDALPAGHEPLSGLRPVQHTRARRAWLLPAGAALFATSAWAVKLVDGTRTIDPVANVVETFSTPDSAAHIPAREPVIQAVSGNGAGNHAAPEPHLMLDTQLLSIARLGAARASNRADISLHKGTAGLTTAAQPVRRRAEARSAAVTTSPPVPTGTPLRKLSEKSIVGAGAIAVTVSPIPQNIRAANPHAAARAALAEGRLHEAETHFQQLTVTHPGDTQAWLYLARTRSEQSRDSDAELALTTALAVVDDPASIARALARRLVTRNGISEALKLLEAYRPQGRLEPDHDAFIAALHQRLGHHDAAAELYRGILTVRPETAAWWVGLAISEEARGHGAAALDAYHHARNLGNLDPRLADYTTQRITAMQGTSSS